jgi:hypothetical protein
LRPFFNQYADLTRRTALGAHRQFFGLFAAIALLCASPAAAHPHVWATVRSEIVFGPDHRITGIRQAWTFDEFCTAMAVQGLDTNGDGVFSKEELQPLAEVNVKSLHEFDYFTFVHLDKSDDNLPLKPPEDYWLDYDKSCSPSISHCRSSSRSTSMARKSSSTCTIPPSLWPSASPRRIR